jgi:NAD(P)-dependent dehydrogenase (short-subunit alcohol dehydrogenase family)
VVNDYGVTIDGHSAAPTAADAVVAEIRDRGGVAEAHYGSVTDHEGVRDLVDHIVATYGGLDALVTCHGILRERMVFNMSEDEWDSVVDVHLKGTFNCVRFASARMREQRRGSMTLFTSAAGQLGNPGQANYAAAKAGVVGLAMSTALAMGKYDVNVNCISPAAATRMTARLTEANTPDAVIGEPTLVAALAVALSRPEARHITGQVYGAAGNRLSRWSNPVEVTATTLAEGWTGAEVLSALEEPVGMVPLQRFAEFSLATPGHR